ncbi:MAG: hypothetical protein BroJett029_22950 [Alphaproteobacteria bacterium]|nr:MAG: hypothetical protein BroJett029_22950 [Alphaproteobacteria bacterium]
MTFPDIDDLIDLVLVIHASSQPGSMDLVKLEALLSSLDEAGATSKLMLLLRLRDIQGKEFRKQLYLAQQATKRLLPNKKPGGGGSGSAVVQLMGAGGMARE